MIAVHANGTAAHLSVNTTAFAMRKTGGTAGQHFTANFCNASGLFAYASGESGCYYQRGGRAGVCDNDGWANSVAFLGLVHDMSKRLGESRHQRHDRGQQLAPGLVARIHDLRASGIESAELRCCERRIHSHALRAELGRRQRQCGSVRRQAHCLAAAGVPPVPAATLARALAHSGRSS